MVDGVDSPASGRSVVRRVGRVAGGTVVVAMAFFLAVVAVVAGNMVWDRVDSPEPPKYHYTAEQWGNFNVGYDAVQSTGGGEEDAVAVVAAMITETGGLNLANDGSGVLDKVQRARKAELSKSTESPAAQGVAGDHGSLGVLQQQFPHWGSVAELMDPHVASVKFLEVYYRTGGDDVADRIQEVQKSAFPDGDNYRRNVDAAQHVVRTIAHERFTSGVLSD